MRPKNWLNLLRKSRSISPCFDHQVAEQFGVWGEKKFMGRTYDGIHRISFLIDEQGKIQHVFDKFKTGEHHQVVLDYLQSL